MTEVQLLNRKPSIESHSEVSPKIIIFLFFSIASAFLMGAFLSNFFSSANWNSLLWGGVSGLIFLVFFLLQTFLFPGRGISVFVILLQSLMTVITFIIKAPIIVSFFLIIFWILYLGNNKGRKLILNSIRINFWDVSKAVLPKGILALAILFGALIPFYLSSLGDQFPFPRNIFREVATSASSITERILPGFNSSSTIEEIARKSSEADLEQLPGAQNLSKASREQIIAQGAASFYKNLSSIFGITVDPKFNIFDAIYDFLKNKFMELPEEERKMIFVIIGIVIFITIESVSWPVRMVVSLLAFLVYEVFIASGIINITLENRAKEVIVV